MSAQSTDWKHLPFGEVARIPYEATFDSVQFDRLTRGLVPEVMEDKWFVYYDEPQLLFHRSWTGQAIYRFTLEKRGDHYAVMDADCASDLVSKGGAEYHAELLNFLIRNLLLGETIPFPRQEGEGEQVPGLLQHAISGTGYPEKIVPKKRWWKPWS